MVKILGIGSYLPETIITNEDLSKTVNTSDEWIYSRVGIKQRHIAKDISCSHMAYQASILALQDAQLSVNEIDLIIFATTTPDEIFPSSATKLQAILSPNKHIPAFDIQAVCSGFIYGLHISRAFLSSGIYKNILFVSSEKMSNLLNWEDRNTSVLFGDGAGAIVIQGNHNNLFDSIIYSDGKHYNSLRVKGDLKTGEKIGSIEMEGKTIFKEAINKMKSSISEICARNNIRPSAIDYCIPHQANARIIEAVARSFPSIENRFIITTSQHANCSAASIPLALDSLYKNTGSLQGKKIIVTAVGAGLTWGAALLEI